VNRILDKIDDPNDKRWLEKRLEHAHEPSLEQRLFEVFKALPLGLDEKRLRAFCQGCAKLRNDISHFGGERHDTSYSEFLKDANTKSEALSVLYHALLLHEAGIDGQILNRWAFDSFLSVPIKIHFVQAGLIDKSALRVDDPPNARPPEGALRDATNRRILQFGVAIHCASPLPRLKIATPAQVAMEILPTM
jgi:hypothetical protein